MKAMDTENKAQIYIDSSHKRIPNFRVVVLVFGCLDFVGG